LLLRVFLLSRGDPKGLVSTADAYESRTTVIYISAICRRWRHVARTCPLLWQCVVFSVASDSSMECATSFMKFSRTSPLFLYVSGNLLSTSPSSRPTSAPALHLFQTISANTYRLYACHLIAPPSELCRFWGPFLPSLRHIFIYGDGQGDNHAIFTRNTPNLQTLWLVDCGMPSLNNPQNLTMLDLTNHYAPARPSLRHFLQSLDGFPRIRYLALHRFYGFLTTPPSERCIPLTQLRTLKLEFCDTLLILSHLDLPPAITISIIHDRFSPADSILSCFPQGRSGNSIAWEPRYIEIALFTSHQEYSVFIDDRTGTRTSLRAPISQFMRQDPWLFECFKTIVSFPPFFSVCSLKLRTDVRCVPWSAWLPRLPELAHLDVGCTDWVSLFNALMVRRTDGGQPLHARTTSLSLEMCPADTNTNRTHLKTCIGYLVRIDPPLKQIVLVTGSWELLREEPSWALLVHSSGTSLSLVGRNREMTAVQLSLEEMF
jgi:hypothetical protein